MLIYLVFITVVNAVPGDDTPSSSFNSTEVVDYDSIFIPESSSANRCIKILSTQYCAHESNPPIDDCAKGAIIYWQKGLIDTPDFIDNYFDTFDGNLIAKKDFQIPYTFCYDEVTKNQLYNSSEVEEKTMECTSELENFRASARRTLIRSMYPQMDVNIDAQKEYLRLMEEMRNDIIHYALFATNLHNLEPNSYEYRYLWHISENVSVKKNVDTTKVYCLKKFTVFDDVTGKWMVL